MRATASSLLIATILCLFGAVPAAAQQQKQQSGWTWRNGAGIRSPADLDKILERHGLWLESAGKVGTQANLSGDDLVTAHLSGARLTGAVLGGARLAGAELIGAEMFSANLMGADLSGADLSGANLADAVLYRANLSGAVFEPKILPRLEGIAQAEGLERMAYEANPGPLTQLRKEFQDAGYREQERAITCALNRHDANPARLRAFLVAKFNLLRRKHDKKDGKKDDIIPFGSFIEGTFKWIAFDLTCEYGLSYGRPLRIVFVLWLFFSGVYAVFMHRPGKSGIYLVSTRWSRGRSNIQGMQIRPERIHVGMWWKVPFLWLRREWRVLRAAMFFSLMSAFNIGFRDINFGRWLRLLTKREYDLKAVGWARTVSGFQSLLSVYLIALWVLSYFGRPFG